MSASKRNDLASRIAASCGVCRSDKPAAAFYPSEFAKYPHPRCRDCHSEARAAASAERCSADAARLRNALGDKETWTAVDAADVMGWKRINAGSHLELLRRHGHIERLAVGVYRFSSDGVAVVAKIAPSPAPMPSMALPASLQPPALFVEAGSYLFGAQNIACVEYDDRGRVSVMLNVQESRGGGHTGPVTYELEGDEAARFISAISLLRGRPPVELTERINALTKERDEARATRDELRTELSKLRGRLALLEDMRRLLDKAA